MGDFFECQGERFRASEERVAPFKRELERSRENQTENGVVADVRSLALALFSSENLNEVKSLNILELLLEKLEADTANRVEFRERGYIPLLVQHMAKNMANKEIQTICCHVFASIADRDEMAQKEIGEREGIDAIVGILHRFEDDPSVCRDAFGSLRGLTLVENNRKAMIDAGVLKCIISALTNFIEFEILMQNAIATLARGIFGNNDARVAFGDLGGIFLITQVLRRYESSPAIQAEAALSLRNLGFECSANHDRMNESHTLDALFKGLRTHIDNHLVTNQTLAAIGNIVTMDSGAKQRILSERAYIAQIFRTFISFANDCCLCRKVGSMLLHLCTYDPYSDRSSARAVAMCCIEEDGCPAIVTAMEFALQFDNALMCKLASLTSELCAEEGFRQSMGDSDGIRILIKSLRTESCAVLQDTLRCISAILSGNDENKRKFSKMGGYPAVMEVMNKYTTNEVVIENCCKALDIGADGQNVTPPELLYGKEDAVAAVVMAMKEFPKIARVQEYSCSLLIKIAGISEEDSHQMSENGVRDTVEMTRAMHSGNTAVESLANQLLSLLTDNRSSRRGRGSVARSGGNASARLRSRSRTIGSRTRSRQEKSKSPIRRLGVGRRAMLAAKAGPSSDGDGKESAAQTIFEDLSARKTEREPKKILSLEPISE